MVHKANAMTCVTTHIKAGSHPDWTRTDRHFKDKVPNKTTQWTIDQMKELLSVE